MENKELKFDLPRGQLNPIILSTLLDKDKYGYEIIEDIKSKYSVEVRQPRLYSSLKRMETQGFISSYWQDSEIGGKRHYYSLTGEGRNFLDKNPIEIQPESTQINSVDENENENLDELKFAQQGNVFEILKTNGGVKSQSNQQEREVQQEQSADFMQFGMFDDSEQNNHIKKETSDTISNIEKQRRLHKGTNDPLQLKYISDEELKSEFERLKSEQSSPRPSPAITPQSQNIWLNRNAYMSKNESKSQETAQYHDRKLNKSETINSDDHISYSEQLQDEENEIDNQLIQNHDSLLNSKETVEKSNKNEDKMADKMAVGGISNTDIKAQKHDDGIFITERIEPEKMPKLRPIAPSTLNIESADHSSFLTSKMASREPIKEDREAKEKYKQRIAEMFSKKDSQQKFDEEKSKLQSKIDKFSEKTHEDIYNPEQKKSNLYAKSEVNDIYKSAATNIANAYDKQSSHISQDRSGSSTYNTYNSYKALEAYYNSKGIGFNIYNKKEKSADHYVNYPLIRFIRGCTFLLYSIILALAFYFGIKTPTIGAICYIIFPAIAFIIIFLYGYSYIKSRKFTIIQVQKSYLSPIILPLISGCAILVTIAINLIIGFRHGTALQYFPVLIYPIFLSLYIALIVPLNQLINWAVLKFRRIN
jgi:DNA-binding PadR family transcriptional regulator